MMTVFSPRSYRSMFAVNRTSIVLIFLLSLLIAFLNFTQLTSLGISVSTDSSTDNKTLTTEETSHSPTGQHLILDLVGCSYEKLNDEKKMRQATLNIIKRTGMTLMFINSFKLGPQGVSVLAAIAESHLTIHTWPEHGKAMVDFFTCGENQNLQAALSIVIEEYGGDIDQSTYSLHPRGDYGDRFEDGDDKDLDQFQPFEIMGIHKYKKKIYQIQSEYQNIAIWDHHENNDDSYNNEIVRSLFLDGVMQSNEEDEPKYHESLVHPAFVATSVAPKRVLIVGGGEGATLREALKWTSVEIVTMVDLDEEVIKASREFLPFSSNCTGFGSPVCFDDERANIYTEDFIVWFDKHIGNDICNEKNVKLEKLYDVIILDLLDPEELPEDQPWARHLYSDLFFKRISCALSDFGVVVSNFGEAPSNPFSDKTTVKMYRKKIKQIQTLSSYFEHTKVYETNIPSFRADWTFVIAINPIRGSSKGTSLYVGINDWNGNPASVNLKLKRGLHPRAFLDYYDGAIQHTYQYPTGGWRDVYCMDNKNKKICDIEKLFNATYEEEWFEISLNEMRNSTSGLIAKQNIKKGFLSGLSDASTSIEIPTSAVYALQTSANNMSEYYTEFYDIIDEYTFSTKGGFTYLSLSLKAFVNHGCSNKHNFGSIDEVFPWTKQMLNIWNPVAVRIMRELEHVHVALRDVKKGEMITENYKLYEEYRTGKHKNDLIEELKEWCD